MMNKFGKELDEYLNYNNISKKEFAERINTTPKNLIDIIKGKIELTNRMIYNISFVTNIPINYILNVESNFKLENTINEFLNKNKLTVKEYLKRFNYKELSKKYNVSFTNIRNDYSILKDILKYLRITNPESLYKGDNSIFYKSKNDKLELKALWLEKCYREVMKQDIKPYNKKNINKLVEYIKSCAKINKFDKNDLIAKFNANGVYLAIEEDLSGSKIRGAFKILNDKPAIYLTTKHRRYADIYFALLHELAHLKSDFNRAKKGSIISDENKTSDFELKADKQALNWMVDDSIYNLIKDDYMNIDKYDVIKSFFVYRLANDKIINYNSKIYQENNKCINYM